MDGYTLSAIILAIILIIGFIVSEISRASYERGHSIGFRRGKIVGRSEVRAER